MLIPLSIVRCSGAAQRESTARERLDDVVRREGEGERGRGRLPGERAREGETLGGTGKEGGNDGRGLRLLVVTVHFLCSQINVIDRVRRHKWGLVPLNLRSWPTTTQRRHGKPPSQHSSSNSCFVLQRVPFWTESVWRPKSASCYSVQGWKLTPRPPRPSRTRLLRPPPRRQLTLTTWVPMSRSLTIRVPR